MDRESERKALNKREIPPTWKIAQQENRHLWKVMESTTILWKRKYIYLIIVLAGASYGWIKYIMMLS